MSSPNILRDFSVDVKRVGDDWRAKVNGMVFNATSEESLREQVRVSLVSAVATECKGRGITEDKLVAKLQRTWRVRIVESNDKGRDDDDDVPIFDLFD